MSAGMELEGSPKTGANGGDSSPSVPIGTGGTQIEDLSCPLCLGDLYIYRPTFLE